jgi:hypothetical protein
MTLTRHGQPGRTPGRTLAVTIEPNGWTPDRTPGSTLAVTIEPNGVLSAPTTCRTAGSVRS